MRKNTRVTITLEVRLCGAIPSNKDIIEMEDIEKLDLLSEVIARTRIFHKLKFKGNSFSSDELDGKIENIPYKKSPN